ncbi:MAG: hypothetical protein ACFB4I_16620 [Cyanophyceae cyanobacterium]
MITQIRQAIVCPLISSYRRARREGQLAFWIISAIAFYTPFEDWIAAWLPVPGPVRTLVRFVPEILLYSILGQICSQRILEGRGLRKTPIDIPVFAIFVSAFFSILSSGASLPGSIANLRTNWRYLAIYYSLVNLDFSNLQLKNLLKNLKIVLIIQGVVASLQFFLPNSFNVQFAAGNCSKADSKGASCGTFLDSAVLSGFLIVAAIVILTSLYVSSSELIPSLKALASVVTIYFGVFASKKRAALFVALVIPLLVLLFLRRRRNLMIALWWSAAIAIVFFFVLSSIQISPVFGGYANAEGGDPSDLVSYFGTIFTKEYWNQTLASSRGWAIVVTINALIKSGRWWFGFGPELGSVQRGIEIFLNPDDQAQLQRNLYVFDDPYWFAITAYFGIVGLLLYWVVLWQLHRASRQVVRAASSEEEKASGAILQSLTVIAFLYSFVERLFRIRPFSFYFWLFAGLAINYYCRQREQRKMTSYSINKHSLSEESFD